MRVTELKIKAFKSFVGLTLEMDAPRILVTGVNGAGKTSLREAIKWALTGKCQGLDGKGSGSDLLIPHGSDAEVAVMVKLDEVGGVQRTTGRAGHVLDVHGFTGNLQAQQTGLLDVLKTTEPFLQAVLDSSRFLDLHHAQAKAFVLDLLQVRIPVGEKTYTLDELDRAYQMAYEERRLRKQDLKNAPVTIKPTDDQPAVEAVEARLTELRAELERVLAGVNRTIGQRTALTVRRIQLETPLVEPRGSVGEAELAAAIEETDERLALLEDSTRSVAVPDHPESIQILRSREEALAQHDPKKGCVLDPLVPCETPKAKFAKRVMVIRHDLEAIPTEAIEAETAAKATLVSRLADLKALQATWAKYHDLKLQRRQDLQAVVDELATLPDVSAQEDVIATLKGRIEKGDGVLKAARRHQDAVRAHNEAAEKRIVLEQTIARLEASCEEFGPSGARVRALSEAIGRFTEAVNVGVAPFGWTVSFILDPWGVLVNGRPVETYSRSEQYRIGIAIQLAVARLSGLSFAIVDELDLLDRANRELVGRLLYGSDLEQVIILATREPDLPLPAHPDLIALRLGTDPKTGRSVVVERVGGEVAA